MAGEREGANERARARESCGASPEAGPQRRGDRRGRHPGRVRAAAVAQPGPASRPSGGRLWAERRGVLRGLRRSTEHERKSQWRSLDGELQRRQMAPGPLPRTGSCRPSADPSVSRRVSPEPTPARGLARVRSVECHSVALRAHLHCRPELRGRLVPHRTAVRHRESDRHHRLRRQPLHPGRPHGLAHDRIHVRPVQRAVVPGRELRRRHAAGRRPDPLQLRLPRPGWLDRVPEGTDLPPVRRDAAPRRERLRVVVHEQRHHRRWSPQPRADEAVAVAHRDPDE